MASRTNALTFGLPRMHKEAGERRDFLPPLVGTLTDLGVEVVVESGIGSGMGLREQEYTGRSSLVRVGTNEEAFGADVVLTLRCPDESEFVKLRPGGILFAMLHFPTRPARVRRLRELGVEAISMDSIVDDQDRRLVEDLRAVAWNGVEAAFDALERTWPAIADPHRRPLGVTIMGAGGIGKHAVEAATKYGNVERNARYAELELPGVEVMVLGRNLTGCEEHLQECLRRTDILVDATQRSDPARPLIPNEWLADLPEHAVICDLVVDPYLLTADPPTVRGVEGIPQGNLDQWIFPVDDSCVGCDPRRGSLGDPPHGRLVLLVARRASARVHGAVRDPAGAAARDPDPRRRHGRHPGRRFLPRAGSAPREPARVARRGLIPQVWTLPGISRQSNSLVKFTSICM